MRCSRYALLLLSLLSVGGCSFGPLDALGFGPPRHPLLESAERARFVPDESLPRELTKRVLSAILLEPGDSLLIFPADLDSPVRIPSDQTILPDGIIDLGPYGRHLAAGKTIPELQALVQQAVDAKEPRAGYINVRLANRVGKVFYVVGEVNSPGSFPYQGRETVLDAILTAGGLTEKASTRNIILSRPTPGGCENAIVFQVCWPAIVQLGDTTTNYQLLPGDRIYVPTRTRREANELSRRYWRIFK